MSKNIVIQEGGIGKQMTVNKLKTDTVNGGTCLWVPEDEISLGIKSITANGTYKASDDGKYGFSQVTVNVAGAPGIADSSGKPVSSGGEPTIGSTIIGTDSTDGETYEYSVDSQGDVTKTLAPTVEPSGAGSSIIGIDPTDGETYEYSVDSQGDVTKTLVPTITPGGPGSGVAGTDPEDGNDYFIGIDSGGNIVKTKIPSGIEIGKVPNKISYTEGETINYSGIIVILKGGDSAVFSNSDYPNGRTPSQELIFPIEKAPAASSGGGYGDGYTSPTYILYSPAPSSVWSPGYSRWIVTTEYVRVVVIEITGSEDVGGGESGKHPEWGYSKNFRCYVFSDRANQKYDYGYRQEPYSNAGKTAPDITPNKSIGSLVVDGVTFYGTYVGGAPLYDNPKVPYVSNTYDEWSSMTGNEQLLWAFQYAYGDKSNPNPNIDIPVQWKSPYDGRTFEDSFNITVTSSSGGTTGDTSSGSGYSDDSGGSSSGGGTGF